MSRHPAPATPRAGMPGGWIGGWIGSWLGGWLGALLLAWALGGPAQAATAPDAAAPDARLSARPPGPAVVAAQQRLDAAQGLEQQARQALRATEQLQQQLLAIDQHWQRSAGALQDAQAAAAAFSGKALPDLRAAHAGWASARADVSRRIDQHHAARAAVARAPARQRAAAAAQADAAALARAQAEDAHEAARDRHIEAIYQANRIDEAAAQRRADLLRQDKDLVSQLADAAQDWQALHTRWQGLQAAVAAQPALRPPPALPAGLQPPGAPWRVPALANAAPDRAGLGPLSVWQQAAMALSQAQSASWLRRDAAAFVQQTLAAPGPCGGEDCAHWHTEARALATEQARLATTQADATTRLAAGQAQADLMPAALADRLAEAIAARQALATALAGLRDPGQPALQAQAAAGRLALAQLVAARQQAEQDFVAAWQAQYGRDMRPPAPAHAAAAEPAPAMSARPSFSVGMAMPALRQHALHRMTQRKDEPPGFGAYTYVVVGTGVGVNSPGVRRRLARLLATLENLPPAASVDAEQRQGTNVFVVPVQAGTENDPILAYELRLAQALMSHVPPALRMPGRLQRALATSNGPFLITLPGRLADAKADWPLLFADLNSVPEAVVADVVRSYMGDLLVGFQPADAGWKPPALQRVALTLVRLVQGSGEVVMAAFPAAMAAPASR